jgi:hypothetical protein
MEDMKKERPILFNGEMVRAVLEGRKTQTRRIMKVQPDWKDARLSRIVDSTDSKTVNKLHWVVMKDQHTIDTQRSSNAYFTCPFGYVGDRLWVRETINAIYDCDSFYVADEERLVDVHPRGWDLWHKDNRQLPCRIIPSIHMPRWASRITLEITDIRVERLNDISEEDAAAEGCRPYWDKDNPIWHGNLELRPIKGASDAFRSLWESLNGEGSREANPWVWVVEFKRVEQ